MKDMKKDVDNTSKNNDEVVTNNEVVDIEKKQNDEVVEPVAPSVDSYKYPTEKMEAVENARAVFLKKYKLQNIFKWIISIASLLIIIGVWVLFPSIFGDLEGQKWVLPVQISVVVLMILIVFGYSLIMKYWLKKKMKQYFQIYYTGSNDYVFSKEDGIQVNFQKIDGRIEPVEFVENNLFTDIAQVSSRDVVEYVYKDIKINSCDCAGQVRLNNKQMSPVFVGKYLKADANYDSDDEIVIYLKGDKRGIMPTNLLHLRCVFDDKKMVIYTNNEHWNKTINSSVKKALLELETDKDLVDVSISLQKGKLYFLLGYDDSLMIVPLQKPFNPAPTASLKEDLLKASEVIALLGKKMPKEDKAVETPTDEKELK